jgi:hypothetical protein
VVFNDIVADNNALKGNKEASIISVGITVLTLFGLYDILGGIFKLFPWTHNTYQWVMFVFLVSLGFVLERHFKAAHSPYSFLETLNPKYLMLTFIQAKFITDLNRTP